MWLLTQQMLASVVAVVAVVGRYCYRIDYWRLMMTVGVVGVAVVAVVGVVAVAAVLLQDWMMTVGTFSKDETLFQQQRRPAGVGTWSSTCCTAPLTWPAGSHAAQDGPGKQKKATIND